ncbi:glycine-rich protein 1-like [Iris pallida]|uniref:Glycine-rich protein 1-like n=1 Tax=Iris pallida TaxID=29817 RepID=A0AAX6GCM7_IRIPA|nr:glycine-rich protein 1-like [Iris pallida]
MGTARGEARGRRQRTRRGGQIGKRGSVAPERGDGTDNRSIKLGTEASGWCDDKLRHRRGSEARADPISTRSWREVQAAPIHAAQQSSRRIVGADLCSSGGALPGSSR